MNIGPSPLNGGEPVGGGGGRDATAVFFANQVGNCNTGKREAGGALHPFNISPLRRDMAVGQGFEPREGLPSTVFKTAAFDHSASPP